MSVFVCLSSFHFTDLNCNDFIFLSVRPYKVTHTSHFSWPHFITAEKVCEHAEARPAVSSDFISAHYTTRNEKHRPRSLFCWIHFKHLLSTLLCYRVKASTLCFLCAYRLLCCICVVVWWAERVCPSTGGCKVKPRGWQTYVVLKCPWAKGLAQLQGGCSVAATWPLTFSTGGQANRKIGCPFTFQLSTLDWTYL